MVTSLFQAKFSGSYEVLKLLSDLNYLISTLVPDVACLASRVSIVHAPEFVAAEVENGLPDFNPSVLHGHSETLCNLECPLGHLPEPVRTGKADSIVPMSIS